MIELFWFGNVIEENDFLWEVVDVFEGWLVLWICLKLSFKFGVDWFSWDLFLSVKGFVLLVVVFCVVDGEGIGEGFWVVRVFWSGLIGFDVVCCGLWLDFLE